MCPLYLLTGVVVSCPLVGGVSSVCVALGAVVLVVLVASAGGRGGTAAAVGCVAVVGRCAEPPSCCWEKQLVPETPPETRSPDINPSAGARRDKRETDSARVTKAKAKHNGNRKVRRQHSPSVSYDAVPVRSVSADQPPGFCRAHAQSLSRDSNTQRIERADPHRTPHEKEYVYDQDRA